VTGFVRGRLRAAKTDGGFTLIEVMVAISISMIVLIGATALMVTTQKIARSSSTRNSNTLDAAIAVQTISRYLQSTTAICGVDSNPLENTCQYMASGVKENGEIVHGATYNDLWFFSNWDSVDQPGSVLPTGGVGTITLSTRAPWRIHLYVATNGDLKADLYKGNGDTTASCCTWSSTPTMTKILAHNVVATPQSGSNPGAPFSYWQHTVSATTPTQVTPWSAASVANKTGSLVDQVNLDVVVAHASNPVVPATEVKDTVTLVNRTHDQLEWKTFP
jgi:type II secretory pathway pseudopilin PulG